MEDDVKILGADWPTHHTRTYPRPPRPDPESCIVCGAPGGNCTAASHGTNPDED